MYHLFVKYGHRWEWASSHRPSNDWSNYVIRMQKYHGEGNVKIRFTLR